MEDLEMLVKDYLFYCQKRKKLDFKTIRAYKTDLTQFITYCDEKNNPFKKSSINNYFITILNDFKPKTAKRKIASLKAFFHFLELEEIILQNPFNKISLKFREAKREDCSKIQRRGKPTNSALLESHYQSEHLQDIGMSRPICCYTSK